MHMIVSDTVVLSDDVYRSSAVMNDVTNSYYPTPNGTFFSKFHFFIFYCVFLLLLVFDYFRLAVNAPVAAPRGGAFLCCASPNHCLSPTKQE